MENYFEKLRAVTSLIDAYEARSYFISEAKKYESKPGDIDKLQKCVEANYFVKRSESLIEYLEKRGFFLSPIVDTVKQLIPMKYKHENDDCYTFHTNVELINFLNDLPMDASFHDSPVNTLCYNEQMNTLYFYI